MDRFFIPVLNFVLYCFKSFSKKTKFLIALSIITFVFFACVENDSSPEKKSKFISFSDPILVNIDGYEDNVMEPFLSPDGNILFFNNSNEKSVNTNLHYAERINDSSFCYMGELKGVNTEYLDAVASIDQNNEFYFVSNREYDATLATIYKGELINDSVSNVDLVLGVSRNLPGWVNFDAEISKDGNYIYLSDGRYDENGGPYEANITMAIKQDGVFKRMENSSILENINTNDLEYAACISSDGLELYFTRVASPLENTSKPEIYCATRDSDEDPFFQAYRIDAISGFVEGPTISPDNQILYFHKKVNNKFSLYMVKKD